MTLAGLFEDHLKLGVRLQAGRALRTGRDESATAQELTSELDLLDNSETFSSPPGNFDTGTMEQASYAVNALLDQFAADRFGSENWDRRNRDNLVGHKFYANLRIIYRQRKKSLLELYALCVLLGYKGDLNDRQDAEIGEALKEAIETGTPQPISIKASIDSSAVYDSMIAKAHHRTILALGFLFVFLIAALLFVYVIAWGGGSLS
jgi:type VI protein secretion system component VasF